MQNRGLTGTKGIPGVGNLETALYHFTSTFQPHEIVHQPQPGGVRGRKERDYFNSLKVTGFVAEVIRRPCGGLFPPSPLSLSMLLSSFLSPLSFHSYLFFLFPFSAHAHPPLPPLFSLLFLAHYLPLALDIFLFLKPNCDITKFLWSGNPAGHSQRGF